MSLQITMLTRKCAWQRIWSTRDFHSFVKIILIKPSARKFKPHKLMLWWSGCINNMKHACYQGPWQHSYQLYIPTGLEPSVYRMNDRIILHTIFKGRDITICHRQKHNINLAPIVYWRVITAKRWQVDHDIFSKVQTSHINYVIGNILHL